MRFVTTKSPGRGEYLDGEGATRLQLVDSSASPALPKHRHFFHHERVTKFGKSGRKLKKPKLRLFDPGADPGVVGYVDYRGRDDVYIELVIVRDDYRGKGVAAKLMDKLYSLPGLERVRAGRVLNPTAWKMLKAAEKRHPKIHTMGSKFFNEVFDRPTRAWLYQLA